MSFSAARWALDHPTAKGTAKLVLIAIADRANKNSFCWPSVASIAQRIGMSRRAVGILVDDLVGQGLITRASRGGGNSDTLALVGFSEGTSTPFFPDEEGITGDEDPAQRQRTPRAESAHPPRSDNAPPRAESAHELIKVHIKEPTKEIIARARPDIFTDPLPEQIPVRRASPKRKKASGQIALIPGDKPRSSGLINGKLDAFRQFWDLYPHRLEHGKMVKPGKWAAEQAFAAAIRRVEPQAIIAAVQNFPFPENPKYIQNPENWLKAGNFSAEFHPVEAADADPFGELNRLHAEAEREKAREGDGFDGVTIDGDLEEMAHG